MVGALFDLSTFSIQPWLDALQPPVFLKCDRVTENSDPIRFP
jgi:hypothetical protein